MGNIWRFCENVLTVACGLATCLLLGENSYIIFQENIQIFESS